MAKHLTVLLVSALFGDVGFAASPKAPDTWDDAEIPTLELPLADPAASRAHAPSDYYYYRIPARAIFRSYPVYRPDKEPPGYYDDLRQRKPEILWDDQGTRPKLESETDWIAAGELVFDAPLSLPVEDVSVLRLRRTFLFGTWMHYPSLNSPMPSAPCRRAS